jgi:hypothetical protein
MLQGLAGAKTKVIPELDHKVAKIGITQAVSAKGVQKPRTEKRRGYGWCWDQRRDLCARRRIQQRKKD